VEDEDSSEDGDSSVEEENGGRLGEESNDQREGHSEPRGDNNLLRDSEDDSD
jgi:hypothetical protein